MRTYLCETASAILRSVSVSLNDTPERKVTPAKDALLLNEFTVNSRLSPSIAGTKHSIVVIALS